MRVDAGEDLYGVLGLEPEAGEREIRAARARLLREWHPDRNPDREALERSREINRAVDLLLDQGYRHEYDRLRTGAEPGRPAPTRVHVREEHRLTRHRGRRLNGLAVRPDGAVAVGLRSDRIRVLDVAGRPLVDLRCDGLRKALAFSPGGELLAATGQEATRVWCCEGWELVGELPRDLPQDGFSASALALHPDGERVLIGEQGARLTLRRLGSGAVLAEWPWRLEGDPGGAVAFSPDGRHLAAAVGAGAGWRLVVVELGSGREVAEYRPAETLAPAPRLAFTPDGRRLRCAFDADGALTDRREACVVELATEGWGVPVERKRCYGADTLFSAYAQAPDGRWWASAGRDGTVIVWDAPRVQPVGRVRLRRAPAPLLAWTPDSGALLVADGWGDLVRWRLTMRA